jgi:hypothetical protein
MASAAFDDGLTPALAALGYTRTAGTLGHGAFSEVRC